MKKKKETKIEELERRIAELEKRLVFYVPIQGGNTYVPPISPTTPQYCPICGSYVCKGYHVTC